MTSTDKDIFRLVPYRFFINGSDTDVCKLEKLTNLFPDMKAIIELELFKFNNLSRMIDRLSHIFTPATNVNTRDDTLQYHIGPYHLSLGPATFGALHFRNISTALLASSHSKKTGDNTNPFQKRRQEAALRRFRRAVRKLILIQSIMDKLRLASILTPFNQYQLYTRGIYDLVLAGHMNHTHSIFSDDSFVEQINDLRLMSSAESENYLFASNYMKISTLLHLMSPSLHQQQQPDINGVVMLPKIQAALDESSNFIMNDNHSESRTNSTTKCCPQHREDLPLVVFPTHRTSSQQPSQFMSPELRSRLSIGSNSRRSSLTHSAKIVRHSLPDLIDNDSLDKDTPRSTKTPPFDLITDESDKVEDVAVIHSHSPSPPLVTNQEDAIINQITSLLTNYLSSRQSSHTQCDHETLEDNTVSPSLPTTEVISNQLSSVIGTNAFDKLLQNIRTVVDTKPSMHSHNNDQICSSNCNHQHVPSGSTRVSKRNRLQHLTSPRTVSLQRIPKAESDKEQSSSLTKKRKSKRFSKSQPLDKTNSESSTTESETGDDRAIVRSTN